ncbi:enhancer of split m4 protein-like [Lutzomyia longipalpis]|uniref:enhancer of split m4 protein-like n=1 Tax=Lutzomyia longipalpis TaxID=7200 RepID=UPI0024842254|nr:enhancer of split m4 protein-like [Lutzomyia longipalpis]
MIHQSDFIIASNNSINDNMYNTKKAKSPAHRVKKMLKPLLKFLTQPRHPKQLGKSCNSHDDFDFWSPCPSADNTANEELEARIMEEIAQCADNAAVYVYTPEDGECHLQPVQRDQTFVPVHFARTDAGTFFWTTVGKEADCDLIQPTYCCSHFQQPHVQYHRWVQA